MAATRSPLRERFELERRRGAFLTFLAGMGIGIIVTDTWINHWYGVAGGITGGAIGYGGYYATETLLWWKRHGR